METRGTSIFRRLKTKDAYDGKCGNRSYTPMQKGRGNIKTERVLTMAFHDAQKLNDDLGGSANEHLVFDTIFGIDDVVQAVILKNQVSFSTCKRKKTKEHSRGRRRGLFCLSFGSVEGRGLKNGRRNISKDARVQNEYIATEARVKQASEEKSGFEGWCCIYHERVLRQH